MIITAPNYQQFPLITKKIFLAGTIDSGNSENWQSNICDMYEKHNNITIINPRRDIWPKASDKSEVENQIIWEHYYLDLSDLIIMNILPDSKSPISLMEIGLYANSGKLIVFCTPEFYRFDNVRLVCKKYNIPLILSNDLLTIYNIANNWLNKIKN